MERFYPFLLQIHPLKSEELEPLEDVFQPLFLKKDSYFAEVGEYSKRFALLGKGIMRAYYQAPGGQQFNKTFFTPPSFVAALSSLSSGQPNKIYIQALTDCELMVADYGKMTALYDRHHGLERLARKFAERVFMEKEGREISLVVNNATERYLHFMETHGDFVQQIPLYHIASYLGITPTQLSRIRALLAKRES